MSSETPPNLSAGEEKAREYAFRIKNGEPKEKVLNGLTPAFIKSIEKELDDNVEVAPQDVVEKADDGGESARSLQERRQSEAAQLHDVRTRLGMTSTLPTKEQIPRNPPVKYTEITIDDEYVKKNLTPEGGLRMKGGQANWNGEVEMVRYVISEKLSVEHRKFVEDKITKREAQAEKTYQHEAHHIRNRENHLTPHEASTNLREFLAFRVLDELSAFSCGELYNQEITADAILKALRGAEKDISDSYFGTQFVEEAKWYVSKHGNNPKTFSREINAGTYHKVMKQYFNFNGRDILSVLQGENKMTEFTSVVNGLIQKLDSILSTVSSSKIT